MTTLLSCLILYIVSRCILAKICGIWTTLGIYILWVTSSSRLCMLEKRYQDPKDSKQTELLISTKVVCTYGYVIIRFCLRTRSIWTRDACNEGKMKTEDQAEQSAAQLVLIFPSPWMNMGNQYQIKPWTLTESN